MNNIIIIRDFDAPGEPPILAGLVEDELTPADEAIFVHSHDDPELGQMVYPVVPGEWLYFALDQTLDTARFLMWQGIQGAPFVLYLGYPADD